MPFCVTRIYHRQLTLPRSVRRAYRSIPLFGLPFSVTCLETVSFHIGCSYAVALLDTDPPQTVEVIPGLFAEFLDGPGPTYPNQQLYSHIMTWERQTMRIVVFRRTQRRAIRREEPPKPMVRRSLALLKLLRRNRLGQWILPHSKLESRAGTVDRRHSAVSVEVVVMGRCGG